METITYKRRKVSGGVAKYYVEIDAQIGTIQIIKIHFVPNNSLHPTAHVSRKFSTHSLVIQCIPLLIDDINIILNEYNISKSKKNTRKRLWLEE
jgi:hypothetical protein